MKRFRVPHPWPATIQEAVALQNRLRWHVTSEDDPVARWLRTERLQLKTVAGVDVAFVNSDKVSRAAVAVLRFSDLTLQEQTTASLPTAFPYVPGLLAFREAPVVLEALDRLEALPDLLLCDGHGLAHPRRFGLACHLGVITGIPSIGVAKRRLIGQHEPVRDQRGAWQPLHDGDELVGAALRTQTGVRPVYVSVGHRISLTTAIDLVLRCTPLYRRPEPIRQAHRLARG